MNGDGSATISYRTKADGGWTSVKPSVVLEGTKGSDSVIILATLSTQLGKWFIAAAQKDNLLRFRYVSDSGVASQFALDPERKTTTWS